MNVLYAANVRMPFEKASSIQTFFMCQELAGLGIKTRLCVPFIENVEQLSFEEIFGEEPVFDAYWLGSFKYNEAVGSKLNYYLRSKHFTKAVVMNVLLNDWADFVVTRDFWIADELIRLKKEKKTRAKIIFECHELTFMTCGVLGKFINKHIELNAVKEADGVIVLTESARKEVERFRKRGNIAVLCDGFNPRYFNRQLEKRNLAGDVSVVYAGSRAEWKGVKTLKDASEMFADGVRLNLLAHIPHKFVADYLRSADILVLPNERNKWSEVFSSPLKLFEYLAAGKVIVASDLKNFYEVLDGYAVFFEPGNAEDLAFKINSVAKSFGDYSHLAEKAKLKSHEFSWNKRASKLVGFLEGLE